MQSKSLTIPICLCSVYNCNLRLKNILHKALEDVFYYKSKQGSITINQTYHGGGYVQTCSKCNTQSPDSATSCNNCQADLREFSTTAVALKRLQMNPRIKNVRLVVAHDCCPACRAAEGTYEKENAPRLPIEGCSHSLGCRCFYEPMLYEIYP